MYVGGNHKRSRSLPKQCTNQEAQKVRLLHGTGKNVAGTRGNSNSFSLQIRFSRAKSEGVVEAAESLKLHVEDVKNYSEERE